MIRKTFFDHSYKYQPFTSRVRIYPITLVNYSNLFLKLFFHYNKHFNIFNIAFLVTEQPSRSVPRPVRGRLGVATRCAGCAVRTAAGVGTGLWKPNVPEMEITIKFLVQNDVIRDEWPKCRVISKRVQYYENLAPVNS